MMKGQNMAGLVFLTLLIACVPTYGEEPSYLPDPTSGNKDLPLTPDPLNPSAMQSGASMHTEAHNTAAELAVGTFPQEMRADAATLPITAESPQSYSSLTDSQEPGHMAEGYNADAYAGVPFVAPTSHSTPPSVTEYIPWSVFNSSDPIYMRRPFLVKPEGDERNVTRGPSVCRPTIFQVQPQSVFNTFPANAIGRFYFKIGNSFFWCSATLIQPTVILTALHCVYDCGRRTGISTGTFYHQFYNGGFRTSANSKSWVGWTDTCSGSFPRTDFAVVRLDRAITLPSYPTVATSTASAVQSSKNGFIYSYPSKTQTGRVPLFSAKNPITSNRFPTPSQFETDLSIEQGSSGSAMYLRIGSTPTIAAVTSYEYTNGQCPNGFAAFRPNNNVQTLLTRLAA